MARGDERGNVETDGCCEKDVDMGAEAQRRKRRLERKWTDQATSVKEYKSILSID